MSKQNTRATIDANIKQNGQQQITGEILNTVLNTMVTDYAEQAETTEKLTDLERKVGGIKVYGTEILIAGGYIENGVLMPSQYLTHTDYIDVGKGIKATIFGGAGSITWGYAWYAEKSESSLILAVSKPSETSEQTLTIPRGAKYIRLSWTIPASDIYNTFKVEVDEIQSVVNINDSIPANPSDTDVLSTKATSKMFDDICAILDYKISNIPFVRGSAYRYTNGQSLSSNAWESTGKVAVKEGDLIRYESYNDTSGIAVLAAYSGDVFIPKHSINAHGTTPVTGVYVVPIGITHIALSGVVDRGISKASMATRSQDKHINILFGGKTDGYCDGDSYAQRQGVHSTEDDTNLLVAAKSLYKVVTSNITLYITPSQTHYRVFINELDEHLNYVTRLTDCKDAKRVILNVTAGHYLQFFSNDEGIAVAALGIEDAVKGTDIIVATDYLYRDKADFNLSNTDCRQGLQTAIGLAAVRHCKVLLTNGDYIINSRNTKYPTLGLAFPLFTSLKQPSSEGAYDGDQFGNPISYTCIEGYSSNCLSGIAPVIKMGNELYASITEQFALIGCAGGWIPWKDYSIAYLKNFKVMLPNNQKPIIALNLAQCGQAKVEDVNVYAIDTRKSYIGVGSTPAIPNTNCYGIVFTKKSNIAPCTYNRIGALGFYVGINIGGEHVTCRDLTAAYNYYGYKIGGGFTNVGQHFIEIIGMTDEHEVCLPSFEGETNQRTPLNIRGYNIAWIGADTMGDIPYNSPLHKKAIIVNPNSFCGEIQYTNNYERNSPQSSGGENRPYPSFFEGDSNVGIYAVNMTHRKQGSTALRNTYEPNWGQEYYDTDLHKDLFYDGSHWIDKSTGNAL